MSQKINSKVYLCLIAALISGFSIFVNKFAVGSIKDPLLFTSIKNTSVAIVFISMLIISSKLKQLKNLKSKDLISLFLIGVIGGAIPFYLFFTGLSTIPAINGAIIQKTLVIWVTILAIPFLKEKLSFKNLIGVVSLFLANFVVGGFSGFKFSTGEILVLISTLFWAAETILAKKILKTVDPILVAAFRMGIGSIILLILSLTLNPHSIIQLSTLSINQISWLSLTIVSLVGYILSWYFALKYNSAISVTSILVSSTLVTNVLTAVFTTHSLNTLSLLQSLLIVSGVVLVSKTHLTHPDVSPSI